MAAARLQEHLERLAEAESQVSVERPIHIEIDLPVNREEALDDLTIEADWGDASAHQRMAETARVHQAAPALRALLATALRPGAGPEPWSHGRATLAFQPRATTLTLALVPRHCIGSLRIEAPLPLRPDAAATLALAGEIAASALAGAPHPVLHVNLHAIAPTDRNPSASGLYQDAGSGTLGVPAADPAEAARRALLLACATLLWKPVWPAILLGEVHGATLRDASGRAGHHVLSKMEAEGAFAATGPATDILRRQVQHPARRRRGEPPGLTLAAFA